MIRSIVNGAALAALVLGATAQVSAQSPPNFRDEWLRQFDASAGKFIALAEAMPAETYTWSPGEGVMPVAQVYMHVARYNYLYPSTSLDVAPPAGVDMDTMEDERRKETVLAALRASMDHARGVAKRMGEEELTRSTRLYGRDVPSWSVLLQLVAHMNEHLGQSIAYARMNDIVPPWSR